jgi:hypothetical protein
MIGHQISSRARWCVTASFVLRALGALRLIAGAPRSDSAMLIKDMLMRSPAVNNISSSRRLAHLIGHFNKFVGGLTDRAETIATTR